MKNYQKHINESIIDPPQKKLSSDIWDKNEKIKNDVKKQIINILNKWKKDLKIPDDFIKNIYLVGSICGYQYTDESDLDITLYTKKTSEERIKRLAKILPNGTLLYGTKHPINFYITDDFDPQIREYIYNISSDKWIKKPQKIEYKSLYKDGLEQAISWAKKISLDIDEFNRDWMEYKIFNDFLGTNEIEIDQNYIKKYIEIKKHEIKADYDNILITYHTIKKFRNEAYQKNDSAFDSQIINKENLPDANYSINNIIYKILEKFGYLEKLLKFKNNPEAEWLEIIRIEEDKIKKDKNIEQEINNN